MFSKRAWLERVVGGAVEGGSAGECEGEGEEAGRTPR